MFIVNVEGAIRKNDKWLIIERSNKEAHAGGLLSLVGGKVNLSENSMDILETTLKREIHEEVDVVVENNLKYIHSTSFSTDNGQNVINIVFLCEYKAGKEFPKSKDEIEKIYWLSTKEIINHLNAPTYLKESIKHAEKLLEKPQV